MIHQTNNGSHLRIITYIKPKERRQRNIESFKCPICGNSDNRYIGIRKGNPYCRKCLTFRGQEATGEYVQSDNAEYTLHYELSDDQKRLSKQLVENYKNGIDSLVHAVCGSGKTEITLNVIKYAISHNQRAGFAIPRRDVVKELFYRFKSFFPNNRVVYLHGGHTKLLEGDLICLTTHQLFRYENYFDLLIIDEIDAFPYAGNEVLQSFMKRSLKGHLIMLSATPSKEVVNEFSKKGKMVLNLNTRFHMHPLPVPQIKIRYGLMKYYELNKDLRRFLQENKPVFVFTPTIEICEQVYNVMRFLHKEISFVHSKCLDRNEKIEDFRNGKYKVLITTAVLERGVTVKNLQVIVFNSNHPLYTSQALIQISGRVGRKKEAPDGEVIFIANSKTTDMEDAVNEIRKANSSL